MQVLGNSYRSLLITTNTHFPGQSYFEMLVKNGPSEEIPLKNGFSQTWEVYNEVSDYDLYEKRQIREKFSTNQVVINNFKA